MNYYSGPMGVDAGIGDGKFPSQTTTSTNGPTSPKDKAALLNRAEEVEDVSDIAFPCLLKRHNTYIALS